MARPKAKDAINAKGFLGVRIPEALKARLDTRAKENARTTAEEVREMIENALAKPMKRPKESATA